MTRDGTVGRGSRGESGGGGGDWDAARVRALREHLRESQSRLADRIGTRQQTVSEWETGSARPRRMSRRLLHIVAEEGGFYSAERAETAESAEKAERAEGSGAAERGGGDAARSSAPSRTPGASR